MKKTNHGQAKNNNPGQTSFLPAEQKKKTVKKTAKKVPVKTVLALPPELDIFRRFSELDGSSRSFAEVQRFHQLIQKAVVEKKIKKDEDHAGLFKTVAGKVAKLYRLMVKNGTQKIENIVIQDRELVANVANVLESIQVRYSVKLLNRYNNLQGTTPTRNQVDMLIRMIENGLENKRIPSRDGYRKQLTEALKTLKDWEKNKGVLEVKESALSGLGCPDNQDCGCDKTNTLGKLPKKVKAPEKKKAIKNLKL
jgi:hypothetical protein